MSIGGILNIEHCSLMIMKIAQIVVCLCVIQIGYMNLFEHHSINIMCLKLN